MRCERCREEAVVDRNDKSPGTCKSLAAAHVATWPSVAAVNESITSTKVVNSHLLVPATNTSATTAQQQIRVMSGKQLLDQQRNLLLLLTETLSTLARYGLKHTFLSSRPFQKISRC